MVALRFESIPFNDPTARHKQSYLSHRAETVLPSANLREIGVVNHSTALEIVKWYQKHQIYL